MAEARHRFAALFSSFVSEIYTSSHHRLSRTTVLPVLEQLDAIAREAQISQPTVHAAQNAIRIICACPNAVHLIRQKWSSILREKVGNFAPSTVAPPSIRASKSSKALSERPVNHYILHFNRLLNVGSDKVFSHFQRLASISERVKPFSTAQPGLSKELCYALEKVVFHVVIVHKKHRRYSIESHAIRSLRGSVNRKMERAGFQNSKFLHRLSKLVVVMASDPAIIKVVYSWARKRSDRSPANDGDSGELAQHTERIQEEDSETSSESESEGSKSHSRKSPSVRSGSRGRSTSQSGSRSKHGSHSRSHSRGRSGSKNRSQSHSRSRGAGSRSRSRSLSRSRAGSHHSHQNDQENDSNLSLQSLEDAAESARDLEVAEYSQNSSIRGSQCDRYEDYDKVNRWKSSPVQSSDELDRTRRHLNSHDSFSDDSGKSDETNLSQWARVELDNERQSAHRLPYGRGRRSRILQHLPLGISPYSMGGEAQLDEHEHALQNGAGRPLSRKLQNTKNSLVNGANYIRGVLKDHIRDHARSDDSEVTDERMKLSREGARYGVDRPSYRSRIRSRSPFPRSGSGSRAGSRQPHVVDSG